MEAEMEKNSWKIIVPILAILVLLIVVVVIKQRKSRQTVVSTFGKYQGYSEAVYDGTMRKSDYLKLSDGTRLAYDLIIPTKKGAPADRPLPVLFKYTPYGRSWTIFDKNGKLLISSFVDGPTSLLLRVRRMIVGDKGSILDPLFRDSWLGSIVPHGYIVVSVDRPGTGASFASPTPGSMETAAKFENEIMDWIATQPWSDGNIAMYGDSQQAMVQFAAASTGNPHLKAILPSASDIEIYQAVEYPGGVFNKAFAALYQTTVPLLDQLATPVDSDPDGVLLAQARESRKNYDSVQSTLETASQCPFHDSMAPNGVTPWLTMDLYPFIDRINQTHTAIYMTVGWYDIFTADMFYWYNSLSVPRHLTIRPTDHSQVSANLSDLTYGTEALRWLDYWLKGIDNGIMDEAPIHYYLQDGPKKGTWQISDRWPLASQNDTRFYFGQGNTGSTASINDNSLIAAAPTSAVASDVYTINYTTTSGTKTRWGAVEEAHAYPDMSANDDKALTYTSPALESDMEITGHPVVHLWLNTKAPDLDVFVYLEEVDHSGKSTYITEGNLRASQRKQDQAPFNIFGLPYQTHDQGDLLPLPSGKPFEMVFSLLPTSYQFHAGSRIRITVAFADAGNFDTPVLNPAPALQLLREIDHPSYVELPIIP
jgi:putative CocE/NonD family hydrolase